MSRRCYTSHGSIKRHNRKSEILLHDIEYAATLASLKAFGEGQAVYQYPKESLDSLWENGKRASLRRALHLLKVYASPALSIPRRLARIGGAPAYLWTFPSIPDVLLNTDRHGL